jgi:hypothetical protein
VPPSIGESLQNRARTRENRVGPEGLEPSTCGLKVVVCSCRRVLPSAVFPCQSRSDVFHSTPSIGSCHHVSRQNSRQRLAPLLAQLQERHRPLPRGAVPDTSSCCPVRSSIDSTLLMSSSRLADRGTCQPVMCRTSSVRWWTWIVVATAVASTQKGSIRMLDRLGTASGSRSASTRSTTESDPKSSSADARCPEVEVL